MTTVAVRRTDDKIEISADSLIVEHGSDVVIHPAQFSQAKVFHVEPYMVGSCGHSAHSALLKTYLEQRTGSPSRHSVIDAHDIKILLKDFTDWLDDEGFYPDDGSCAEYIIIVKGQIFQCYNVLDVYKVSEFTAIGSGAVAAIAAMTMGASTAKAVDVASSLDAHTGGEVLTAVVKT